MSGRQEPDLPIAALDTSVLVSSWSRLALQQLAEGHRQRYQPVWSEWIVAETWYILADRAARKGIPRKTTSIQSKQMMRYFLPVMRLVSVAHPPPTMPPSPLDDRDDAEVWATAFVGEAQYVVSHNTTDFPPLAPDTVVLDGRSHVARRHLYEGIEFLTAIEFIESVLGTDPVSILGRPLPERGVIRSRRSVTPL